MGEEIKTLRFHDMSEMVNMIVFYLFVNLIIVFHYVFGDDLLDIWTNARRIIRLVHRLGHHFLQRLR